MSALPERPFVPHRTPKTAKPVGTQSEFRLSRPFVPGSGVGGVADAATSDAAFVAGLTVARVDVAANLPPIEDFVGSRQELGVQNASVLVGSSSESDALDAVDDLPPIEHFVDPLPQVDAFAPADQKIYGAQPNPLSEYSKLSDGASGAGRAEAEWGETDWQQYDWRSAAALGETANADDEASVAWAATDWEGRLPVSRPGGRGTADAIASALDQIAQRIRNGDLSLPSASTATDPAAIAATLAALLGVKR